MNNNIYTRSEKLTELLMSLDKKHKKMHFVVNVIVDPPNKNLANTVLRKLEQSRFAAKLLYGKTYPRALVPRNHAENTFLFRIMDKENASDRFNILFHMPKYKPKSIILSIIV